MSAAAHDNNDVFEGLSKSISDDERHTLLQKVKTKTPENDSFVAAYKAKFGSNRVTSDPAEAAYDAVYLWADAAKKAVALYEALESYYKEIFDGKTVKANNFRDKDFLLNYRKELFKMALGGKAPKGCQVRSRKAC